MEAGVQAWGGETVKLRESPVAPPWELDVCEEVFSLMIAAFRVTVLVTEECH